MNTTAMQIITLNAAVSASYAKRQGWLTGGDHGHLIKDTPNGAEMLAMVRGVDVWSIWAYDHESGVGFVFNLLTGLYHEFHYTYANFKTALASDTQ